MKAALLFTVCLVLVLGLVSAAAVKHDADAIKSVTDQLKALVGNMADMVKVADNNGDINLKDQLDMEHLVKELVDNLNIEETEAENDNQVTLNNAEDDNGQVSLGDGEGMRCVWHGLAATCCQRISDRFVHFNLCIKVLVRPPSALTVTVILNSRVIFRRTIGSHRNVLICTHFSRVKLCVLLYGIEVSRHSAQICLKVSLRALLIHLSKNLGCIRRRFASDESETAQMGSFFDLFNTNNQEQQLNGEGPLQKLFHDNKVLRFQQDDQDYYFQDV